MTIFILLIITYMVLLTCIRYQKLYKLIISAIVLFIITSSVLVIGIVNYTDTFKLSIFGNQISKGAFEIFIGIWYFLDIICLYIILKNYKKLHTS